MGNTLTNSVTKQIENMFETMDFPSLYKNYAWKNDRWTNGFPEIYSLECVIGEATRNGTLSLKHLKAIAQWGGLPGSGRINCRDPIQISLFDGDTIARWASNSPENAIRILEGQISGFGPTYTSKLLRFAAPELFGAIDTRIVRIFGGTGLTVVSLVATPFDGRWAISRTQKSWPGEYGTWVSILSYIATGLKQRGIPCTHPEQFVKAGLREYGVWANADVEMALFNYASQQIQKAEGKLNGK